MKKIILLSFLFFASVVFSQQEASNWYFGENAGIKFHPDGSVTTLLDGQLNTKEGCYGSIWMKLDTCIFSKIPIACFLLRIGKTANTKKK